MNKSILSKKIQIIAPSMTLALNAKAKEMGGKGIDVLNFCVGEPDFDTPENIKAAAHKAIDDGYSKYTPANGLNGLRDAIVDKFRIDNEIFYSAAEIIVGSGAKPLLYAALEALCDPGDEVLLAAPYWVSYTDMIGLVDAVPVIVEAREEDGFELKASAIEAKITDRTKVLILNSPSNPTGAVISESEIRKIAELAVKYDFYVISDEIYEKLIFEGKHFSIASISEELRARTVTINGGSKAYAITGWRLGYCGAPLAIAKAMGDFLSHVTGNANSIAQVAFIEALKGPQDAVEAMRLEFMRRRDVFVEGLNSVEGISCPKPSGAFYLYPNFSALYNDKITNSMEMAEYLLDELHIATVPGIAFGTDEHIRFSYAASMEVIERCVGRLKGM
jgi:aspartate aminotransferase